MNTQYLQSLPEDWQPIANVFSALGDTTRQKILLLFEPGERIERKTLLDLLPLSRTAANYHLTTLVRVGLLIPEKRGRNISYTLNHEALIRALELVRNYAAAQRDQADGTS